MRFEWDETKNRLNVVKHGVSFEIAQLAFLDPLQQYVETQWVRDEERAVSLARLPNGTILVIVYVATEIQGDAVLRIISARKAEPHERRRYQENS